MFDVGLLWLGGWAVYVTQHIDHSKYCHVRAHQDYCLVLETNISGHAFIIDTEVFIRVQAPEVFLNITHGTLIAFISEEIQI